jgi:hypothetical protein
MGLLRVKARWSIPGAGTAYSVLHFTTNDTSTPVQEDADDAYSKTHAFFFGVRGMLPPVVQINVEPEVEEINEGSGELIGGWGVTAMTQITGTGSGSAGYAAATGAVVSWTTAGVRNGRRVRGRTFIVPLSVEAYDTNGSLSTTAIGQIGTAATTLRTVGQQTQFAIYSRPSGPAATDGIAYGALSHKVPDMSAVLRSRRS